MNESGKVINFTDLKVWQLGHQVVLAIYKATKEFPKEELFALVNQLRRAAISFTSNITEGFSRSTAKDKIYFYSVALGSLTELQNQLLIATDLKYMSPQSYLTLKEKLIQLHKMTNGLIKTASSRF